ncbi:hypothetical protein RRF57_001844 [Xylaria bambusicola]|uniref:Uncharacterized protein n=1 Tax=Xylaria bambusicola TaxID=326684 RepID=A0AAN7UHT2_9PEZI
MVGYGVGGGGSGGNDGDDLVGGRKSKTAWASAVSRQGAGEIRFQIEIGGSGRDDSRSGKHKQSVRLASPVSVCALGSALGCRCCGRHGPASFWGAFWWAPEFQRVLSTIRKQRKSPPSHRIAVSESQWEKPGGKPGEMPRDAMGLARENHPPSKPQT